MAIRFQYNKVSLQDMQKQLKVRLDTLPILKFKEAILRAEAEKAKKKAREVESIISTKMKANEYMDSLWREFPHNVIVVKAIKTSFKNIAGVNIPQLEAVDFELKPLCLFNLPYWTLDGIVLMQELVRLRIEKKVILTRTELLEETRKKTTQKVNLYEKVQVPGYEDAISKIIKFMSDEESLGKAVQKIMKKRILSI